MVDDLAAAYRASGFNRELGFGTMPVVLVVDLCQAYFTAGSPLALPSDNAMRSSRTLIAAARRNDVPVIWTRVEFEPGGGNGGVFYRKVAALSVFDRGQPLGDWVPGVAPEPDELIITKQQASAFFGTELAEELARMQADTVIVCGVSTSGCVRATAVDACQHDFVPIVVDEACGDRSVDLHRSTLFDLDAKYADVKGLGEVVGYLDAGTTR